VLLQNLQQPTDVFDLKIACSGECLTRGVKQGVEIDYIVDPWACGDTLIDSRDSKEYPTVQIDTQCWMAANLNVGTFTSVATLQGTDCPSAAAIEKYCYLNGEGDCTTYGGLYNWDQAMCGSTTEGATGICPTGWHLPTDTEQYTLENYLKDAGQTCDANRNGVYDCSTAGTKLKSGGTSGFNVLFGGLYELGGGFNFEGNRGFFWSSVQSDSNAWYRTFLSSYSTVRRHSQAKTYGLSVRCLNDLPFSPPNTAPALTSVATSPNPIQGGSALTITPTGQADDDSDALYYYCNETGTAGGQAPTSANTLCTEANTSYATPYSSMTCSYAVTTGNTTRTVYCRTYDGTEYSSEVTTTYAVDTTAPTVSDVSSIATDSTATITWTTNEAGSSKVDYGTTSSYGTSTTETDTSTRVTSHSVSLTGLSSCLHYHYRVRSTDSVSNETIGEDNTFTTTGCGGALPSSKEDQINQIMQKLISLIKQAIKLISEKARK